MKRKGNTELSTELTKVGHKKDLVGLVGMPDRDDKRNIMAMITKFERENPGMIAYNIRMARDDHANSGHDLKFNIVGQEAGRRHVFELPEGLVKIIEMGYPLMFTDKKHFAWFCKNFSFLMIPEKY